MRDFLYIVMGALLLAGCTRDLTDQRISEAETATAEKILNESSNALQGSIIVRFAPSAESRLSRCATRTGATRTGVEGVDAILDNISVLSFSRLFDFVAEATGRGAAQCVSDFEKMILLKKISCFSFSYF